MLLVLPPLRLLKVHSILLHYWVVHLIIGHTTSCIKDTYLYPDLYLYFHYYRELQDLCSLIMFHSPIPIEHLYISLVFSCSMCLGLLPQLLVLSCASLLHLPLCHLLTIFHSQPQYVAHIVLIYLIEQSYSFSSLSYPDSF